MLTTKVKFHTMSSKCTDDRHCHLAAGGCLHVCFFAGSVFPEVEIFSGRFIMAFRLSGYPASGKLEGMARYARQLLSPAEAFGPKKGFYAVFAHFRPFLMFSRNHSKFQ